MNSTKDLKDIKNIIKRGSLQELIDKVPDPLIIDYALIQAVIFNQEHIVKYLLNIDGINIPYQAYKQACKKGFFNILKLLISKQEPNKQPNEHIEYLIGISLNIGREDIFEYLKSISSKCIINFIPEFFNRQFSYNTLLKVIENNEERIQLAFRYLICYGRHGMIRKLLKRYSIVGPIMRYSYTFPDKILNIIKKNQKIEVIEIGLYNIDRCDTLRKYPILLRDPSFHVSTIMEQLLSRNYIDIIDYSIRYNRLDYNYIFQNNIYANLYIQQPCIFSKKWILEYYKDLYKQLYDQKRGILSLDLPEELIDIVLLYAFYDDYAKCPYDVLCKEPIKKVIRPRVIHEPFKDFSCVII
jgi:hypothetical protein